jgi:hypothetical protein
MLQRPASSAMERSASAITPPDEGCAERIVERRLTAPQIRHRG